MDVEKIKEHIKRHKTLYISIGCVALGIGIAVLAGRIVKNLDRRELLVPDVKGSIVNYGSNNGIVGTCLIFLPIGKARLLG